MVDIFDTLKQFSSYFQHFHSQLKHNFEIDNHKNPFVKFLSVYYLDFYIIYYNITRIRFSNNPIILSKVVLPEPLFPIIATNSPLEISRLNLSIIDLSLNFSIYLLMKSSFNVLLL